MSGSLDAVIIETERLTLRPLTLDDAPTIQELFDDPSIAEQLPSVRYPLPPDGAERWIREVQEDVTFGCVGREEDTMGVLGGFVGLHLEPGNRAQIGGWCGKQFRHNGYAVEAGRAVVRYGYEVLGLKTIYALRKGSAMGCLAGGRRAAPAAPPRPRRVAHPRHRRRGGRAGPRPGRANPAASVLFRRS